MVDSSLKGGIGEEGRGEGSNSANTGSGSFPDWCRAPPEVSKESSKNGEDLVVNEHRRVKLHKFEGSREGRGEGT